MDNMRFYNAARAVPDTAQKTIKGGRLNGFTDINPQWRIERLTELFGMCGVGWKYEITQQWLEPGTDGVISAFCNINLYVKSDGEWSDPIPGTGGSAYVSKERNGLYTSDEAYKMALTDALSVACKALGFGADIYWAAGRSIYSENPEQPPTDRAKPLQTTLAEPKDIRADPITPEQVKRLFFELDEDQIGAICLKYEVDAIEQLSRFDASKILAQLAARKRKEQNNG